MQALMSVISPVFWGALVLSALVFVHEGGHFLAARACGVRVTEFFLGMPCRFNVHHVSKRIGTKFGVTPILLGGYAAICGMDPEQNLLAASVLDAVHRHGTVSVDQLAEELQSSSDDVLDACVFLLNWGSISPVYDEAKGEGPNGKIYPSTYASMPRDPRGNTVFDGRMFDRARATKTGEPWTPPMDPEAFLEFERSRTYLGKGFWKRALMLVAGIAVNIVSGFLIMVFAYSVLGTQMAADVNVLGDVAVDSPAWEAGIRAGDAIEAVGDVQTSSFTDIYNALQAYQAGDTITLTYRRDGGDHEVSLKTGSDGKIGIAAKTETVRLAPLTSMRITASYLAATAQGVAQLVQPQHTAEVLQNSSSIVGISVMSAQAASEGPSTLLAFAALISFSLAFMNLLPIPPLDGGKLLIEVIQAVTRRSVPLKVQTYLSYAGVALFGILFIFMLRTDILRLL